MSKSDRYLKLENNFRRLAETHPQDRVKFLSHAEGWRYLADASDFIGSQKTEMKATIDGISASKV